MVKATTHIQRAYPRSRGGTLEWSSSTGSSGGLSPLARGNRKKKLIYTVAQGPIPARAGEPDLGALLLTSAGAYPRSRGGTSVSDRASRARGGLSPLARGNLVVKGAWQCNLRPIPARAGEPEPMHRADTGHGAYPRSRGGTTIDFSIFHLPLGLSPLARGNP